MGGIGPYPRRAVITVLAFGIVLPLSLLRRVSSLAFSSGLSLLFVLLLVASLSYRYGVTPVPHAVAVTVSPLPLSFWHFFMGAQPPLAVSLAKSSVCFMRVFELVHARACVYPTPQACPSWCRASPARHLCTQYSRSFARSPRICAGF